jgi:hypothetical protein
MSKVSLFLSAVIFSALAGAPAAAETSIACTYMLLRVYHAELDACHVALPNDREARYSRMRASMEKFIHANAKNDPLQIILGIEKNNIPTALKGLKSCQSEDFSLARQAMDQMTSAATETLITNTLMVPRDPMIGDCSS